MINSVLLSGHLVVDPQAWEILLIGLIVVVGLGLVYLVRIHIAYRMAKNRHRDPLGWVLLSFFFSPLLSWVVLLIVGDDDTWLKQEQRIQEEQQKLQQKDEEQYMSSR